MLRFACDIGGTFTDLVVEDEPRGLCVLQAPDDAGRPGPRACSTCSTPAAADLGIDVAELLGRGELFIHGTTRAINAILTGRTARDRVPDDRRATPTSCCFREGGGRTDPFDYTRATPSPTCRAR